MSSPCNSLSCPNTAGLKIPHPQLSCLAIFVAILTMASPVPPLAGQTDSKESRSTNGRQTQEKFTSSDGTIVEYLLFKPDDAAAANNRARPLMLFLHGRGESKGPVQRVAQWGPPKFAQRGDDLPYILVSPQCPEQDGWGSETQLQLLTELLDHIESQHPVDSSQIFLTGLSMGGYGCWALAARNPDRFAAVAPICGGGDPAWATSLKSVPIWAFHGTDDRVVPLEKSETMVNAIRAAGGTQVRLTKLEHIGHNSWSAAYATPELYEWMQQSAQSDESKSPR